MESRMIPKEVADIADEISPGWSDLPDDEMGAVLAKAWRQHRAALKHGEVSDITYPPEMLPRAGEDGADVIVVDPDTGEHTLIPPPHELN
jgi:hypothetical protein